MLALAGSALAPFTSAGFAARRPSAGPHQLATPSAEPSLTAPPTRWPHAVPVGDDARTAQASASQTAYAAYVATYTAWLNTTPAAPWPWQEPTATDLPTEEATPTSVPTHVQSATPRPSRTPDAMATYRAAQTAESATRTARPTRTASATASATATTPVGDTWAVLLPLAIKRGGGRR